MRPGPFELIQKNGLEFARLINHLQLLRHKSYQETVGSETLTLYHSRQINYQQLFSLIINYSFFTCTDSGKNQNSEQLKLLVHKSYKQTSDGENMHFVSYEDIEKLQGVLSAR